LPEFNGKLAYFNTLLALERLLADYGALSKA
jgi:hypothetical protein